MVLKLLTYNVLFNQASLKLKELAKQYRPDIICLQEVDTEDKNINSLIFEDYQLADFSNSFIQFGRIFGIATYYNSQTLTFIKAESLDLSRGIIETLMMVLRLGYNDRSVLKTEFRTKENNNKITVYNTHYSAFAFNNSRNKQISTTFTDIDMNPDEKTIICGDFNYPYGRRKFEDFMKKFSLKEATHQLFYTQEQKLFGFIPIKLKLDYILYKNLDWMETIRIHLRNSDHYPILATFKI